MEMTMVQPTKVAATAAATAGNARPKIVADKVNVYYGDKHELKDVTVVALQDARLLDSQQLESLGEQLYRMVDQMDRKKLVVDCTKVQFMASAAITSRV